MYNSKFSLFTHFAFSGSTVKKSVQVMLVVGFLLNFINQGEALFSFDFANINWFKFFLTFLVPYLVATYSAAQAGMTFAKGEPASASLDLECDSCGAKIHVEENEIIPDCKTKDCDGDWNPVFK